VVGDDHVATDVYFKATYPLFHAEPAITQLLAKVVPDHVPELLAVDHAHAFMLTGALPGEDPDRWRPEVATAASRVIARTQMTMTGHLAELRASGAPDRTLEDLSMIVSDSVELDQLTVEERDRVRHAKPWLALQLRALSESGLPYTISHGDLHVGNIAEGGGQLVIYDWTDAAIWQTSRIATKIYQAISYERIYRAQEPRTRWELGGIVARLLRDLGRSWAKQSER
jgi:hypothetical protein